MLHTDKVNPIYRVHMVTIIGNSLVPTDVRLLDFSKKSYKWYFLFNAWTPLGFDSAIEGIAKLQLQLS